MEIYFAMLVPVITVLVQLLFFRRRMAWWEHLLTFGVSIVTVLLAKITSDHVTKSEEYWGSIVTRVEYYEKWDEWIDETCQRECCCDSEGKNCGTETYDCSYRRVHQPEWSLRNTIGEEVSISQKEYNRIAKVLGTEKKTDMHRDYYRIDGDMFSADWQGDSLTAIPVTTVHYYENKVKLASSSIFHFDDLDPEEVRQYDLKEYPDVRDGYKMDAVIGDSSRDASVANKKLMYLNGKLGPMKEVRAFILVFKDQPMEAAFKQEAYWKGANMNEFIVCIGIDSERNVSWCRIISWTTNETLKVEFADFVMHQKKLNLKKVAEQLGPSLMSFERRDFKEFNYLTVEPSLTAIIVTYVITILVNIGVTVWAIRNEFNEDGTERPRFMSSRRF